MKHSWVPGRGVWNKTVGCIKLKMRNQIEMDLWGTGKIPSFEIRLLLDICLENTRN